MSYDEDEELPVYPLAGRVFYAGFDLTESLPYTPAAAPFKGCSPIILADEGKEASGLTRLYDFLRFLGLDGLGSCQLSTPSSPFFREHHFIFALNPATQMLEPLAALSTLVPAKWDDLQGAARRLAKKMGPNKAIAEAPGKRSFLISDRGLWTIFEQPQLCEKDFDDSEVAWLSSPLGEAGEWELVILNRKALCEKYSGNQLP